MRLTKNIRDEIVRNAMALRFDKLQKELYEDERRLQRVVYDFLVPAEARKAIETLRKLTTAEWFTSQTLLNVTVDYHTVQLCGDALPLPRHYNILTAFNTRDTGEKGAMAKTIRAFDNRRTNLKDEREKVQKQLMVLLKSVHSTESLAKVWPEGAKLYSTPPLKAPMAGLPAVQIAELNKLIGLQEAA